MISRLQTGSFNEDTGKLGDDGSSVEKKAMLVYCGKFESLDGAVEITDEDIDKLAGNHNSFLSKLAALGTGGVPAKFSPPIQLDHSTSAKDTVGRLVGNLEIGEHTLEDGTRVKALMGTVKILGKENVERVNDGRWTHLSIGADLQNHKISELTITPFPAAADASLLKSSLTRVIDSWTENTGHGSVRCEITELNMGDGGGFVGRCNIQGKWVRTKVSATKQQVRDDILELINEAYDTNLSAKRMGARKEIKHKGKTIILETLSAKEAEYEGFKFRAWIKEYSDGEPEVYETEAVAVSDMKENIEALLEEGELSKLGKVFEGKVLGVSYAVHKDGGKYYWSIKGHGEGGKMHDQERAAVIEAESVIRDLKSKGELSGEDDSQKLSRLGWEVYKYQGPTKKFSLLVRDDDTSRVKVEVDGKTSSEFSLERHPTDGPIKELIPELEKKSGFKLINGESEKYKRLAWKDEYDNQDIFKVYKEHDIGLVIDEKGQMHWNVYDDKAKRGGGPCSSEADGKAKAQKFIDEKLLSKLSKGDDEMLKYAEMKEKMAQYEKCKKHLMDTEKMSEEDADKKLGEMDDESVSKMAADRDAHEAKMTADADADDAAKKQMSAKLRGTADGLKRLVGQFKTTADKMNLAQKKSNIVTRLSRLKAEAKITPAELKKMNVDEMAKKDEKLIDEALKTYEGREAVLHLGVYGSVRAMSTGQLHGNLKKMQMERQELESRLNMPSKREAALKRLQELQEEEKDVNIHIDNVPQGEHTTDMSGYDLAYDEMKKLMDEGKHDEAKAKMKSYMSSLMKSDMTSDVPVGDVGKEMSALAEEVKKMQTGLVDFVKLTAPVLGLKAEELVG